MREERTAAAHLSGNNVRSPPEKVKAAGAFLALAPLQMYDEV